VGRGEKTWNGVAILSKIGEPIVTTPSQPAMIEAAIGGILLGCLNAPNGNPQPNPKIRLQARLAGQTMETRRAPAMLYRPHSTFTRASHGRMMHSSSRNAERLTSAFSTKARPTQLTRSTLMSRCYILDYLRSRWDEMPDCGWMICWSVHRCPND
jgi:hypothetical protein